MKEDLVEWYAKNFIDQFYEVVVPEKLNMTYLALDRWADKKGDLPAIYFESEVITFKQLQKTVNKIGNALIKQGVKPGDRVLIRMGNHPMYLALNLAIVKIGAVTVPTSTLFRERELGYIIKNCEATLAIAVPDLVPQLEAVKERNPNLKKILTVTGKYGNYECIDDLMKDESEELEAYKTTKNDLAFILYTSGTTGFPKGVPHKHAWMVAVGDPNVKFVLRMGPGDRMFTPIEMTWMWPWGYCFWWTLYAGGATCIYTGRFDPERTWSYIEKYKATHILGNPTIYRRLLRVVDAEKKYNISSLKMAFSSGETVEPELFNEWKRRTGTELYDCLGQTESHVFVCTRFGVVKPGSLGKPLPGCPVAVIREDGSLCDVDEIGYLALDRRWEALTAGYLKLEEEWSTRIKGDWYLSWDYAKVDKDGFFWYVSRADDLIKSRGYLIGPKEIEDVLAEHQAVLESAVIGVKDPEIRERIKAFIVLKEGYKPSTELANSLIEFVKQKLAPYKAPKEIEFVESLPKTVTGKIMRKELKKQEEAKAC
jgi:acyl-coenzyme A synthetase/AMP-(fatty) acid ligase